MGQPVKLSDNLVLDARLIGETTERSIAGQIEFWAGLGRAIEPLLRMPELLALRKAAALKPLSACLEDVETPAGRKRLAEYLRARPFPHYELKNGHLVRIDKDGTRTAGRFVNRKFKPLRKQK
jgi:hypothetical protein